MTHEPSSGPVLAPPPYRFPREPGNFLHWASARELLEASRYYWLATTRPDGRPYLTPLWGVWIDDVLYLDGAPTTRWARNLAANPAATIHVGDGNEVVIVDGVVDDVTTEEGLGAQIVEAWSAKYAMAVPNPVGDGVLRLQPRVARAWSHESLHDGARFTFPADR